MTNRSKLALLAAPCAGLVLLAACLDEQIVYRDRPIFNEPPAGSAQFLGYTEVEDKLTSCGNCHVGMHADWVKTAHAGAWDDLQDSGHAQASCEGCHSVNELGNAHEGSAGWVATKDARYQDVQCESCHGPGLPHVQNPDASQPLASILAAKDATAGCGECHSGVHNPFVEEWQASRHGTMAASPQGNASCVGCHESPHITAHDGPPIASLQDPLWLVPHTGEFRYRAKAWFKGSLPAEIEERTSTVRAINLLGR